MADASSGTLLLALAGLLACAPRAPRAAAEPVAREPVAAPDVKTAEPAASPSSPSSPSSLAPVAPAPTSEPALAAPEEGPESRQVASVAAGDRFTCALTTKHEVYCWGDNEYGQLGDGTKADRHRPMRLPLSSVAEIGAGNYFGCARLESGAVRCWGSRVKGCIGDGGKDRAPTAPTAVPGLSDVVRLEVDPGAVAAIEADGTVFHWGGQSDAAATLPLAVPWPALRGVLRVDQTFSHGCALGPAIGELHCFAGGISTEPILGDRTTLRAPAPGVRIAIPPVRAFCARGDFTCAAVEGGAVYCWGGHLLVPTEPSPNWEVPTRIAGLAGVTALACDVERVCAVHEDRTVSCFGENGAGQLGDGTKISRHAPRPVVGLVDVAQVAHGADHACAVTTHGALYCWGANDKGQLGDGTRQGRTVPARIAFGP